MRTVSIVTLMCAFLPSAHAGSWTICNYTIETLATNASGIRAEIKKAASNNPDTCLAVGAVIGFKPETPDYQSELARRKWPKAGQLSQLRYRELDGICKNDGNEKPCTITHYSIMKAN